MGVPFASTKQLSVHPVVLAAAVVVASAAVEAVVPVVAAADVAADVAVDAAVDAADAAADVIATSGESLSNMRMSPGSSTWGFLLAWTSIFDDNALTTAVQAKPRQRASGGWFVFSPSARWQTRRLLLLARRGPGAPPREIRRFPPLRSRILVLHTRKWRQLADAPTLATCPAGPRSPTARNPALSTPEISHPSFTYAQVAELADAPDLGSGGVTRGGSSPSLRTTGKNSSKEVKGRSLAGAALLLVRRYSDVTFRLKTYPLL